MIRFLCGLLIAALVFVAPQARAGSAKQSFERYQQIAQVGLGQQPNIAQLQPSPGGVTPTYTAGACANNHATFTTSPQSFPNMNGGVAYASNGLVVVGFVQDQNYSPPASHLPSTFQIGLTNLTYISGSDDGTLRSSLWYAAVTAGTTDTITLTQPGGSTSTYTAVCAAFITGMTATPTGSSSVAYGSASTGATVASPFNINASGFGVVLYGSVNASVAGAGEVITFTNTTAARDQNSLNAGNIQITMAHQIAPVTSWSPAASGSPTAISFGYALSAAAWAP